MIFNSYCNLNYILFIKIYNLSPEVGEAIFLEKTQNLAFLNKSEYTISLNINRFYKSCFCLKKASIQLV